MPKPLKTYNNTPNYRTLPYPTTTSAATMPMHRSTTSKDITPQTTTSPLPGGNRHSSASWPQEHDEILMQARQQGLNWQPIASKYFPDKTSNACRKRHERLMEKSNSAGTWDGAKMETLAKAYNDVREQMWRILADRIGGEKWQTVEAKCMEKGLKTLQTAGRTAARRERTSLLGGNDFDGHIARRERSLSHNSDDFNDSAIGPDADHPFATRGQDDHPLDQTLGPFSSGGTPSYSSGRTFSNASSSLSSFTPTITAPPQFPSRYSPTEQQTLPSFSAAFGAPSLNSTMPNISSIMQAPDDPKH